MRCNGLRLNPHLWSHFLKGGAATEFVLKSKREGTGGATNLRVDVEVFTSLAGTPRGGVVGWVGVGFSE